MVMEHRWADRRTVDIKVRLRSPIGNSATGQMVSISRSGAFILTDLGVPFADRVDILIGDHVVPAYVTRDSPAGVGVEWLEWMDGYGLAPKVISALLQGSPQPLVGDRTRTLPCP